MSIGGAKASGSVPGGTTFDPKRLESPAMPTISFFRNRWYDAETGRWTQEDPLGVGGGINLYQYVGGNPVAWTDPFGLKVCFSGSPEFVEKTAEGTRQATHTTFTLDKQNCATDVKPVGKDFTRNGRMFAGFAADTRTTYRLYENRPGIGAGLRYTESFGDQTTYHIGINPNVINNKDWTYGVMRNPSRPFQCGGRERWSGLGIVAVHELGHFNYSPDHPIPHPAGIMEENDVHTDLGERLRCYE